MLDQFENIDPVKLNPNIYYNFGYGYVADEFRKLGVINLNAPYERQMENLHEEVDQMDAPTSKIIEDNFFTKTRDIMMKVIAENAEHDKHLPPDTEGEKSQRMLSNKIFIKAPPWMHVTVTGAAWSLGFTVYVPKIRMHRDYQYNPDGTPKLDDKGRHIFNRKHIPTSIVPLPRIMVAAK